MELAFRSAGSLLVTAMLAGCVSATGSIPANRAPAYPDLEAIDVDRDCNPNAALDGLLDLLGKSPLAGESVPVNWMGRALEQRVHIWEGMAWKGLTLHSIGRLRGIASGPAVFSLYFRDAPDAVLARLNADGYELPRAGEDRGIDGALSIGVHATEDGSALTCWFD